MRNSILGSIVLGLALASTSSVQAADPVCKPAEEGQLRCVITKLSDCDALNDYPYARSLFCPAAFSAVQEMVSRVSATIGSAPSSGFFTYFQTLADPLAPVDAQSQTTAACLATSAPFPGGSKFVVGAGLPLCDLVAYVTSPGPGAVRGAGQRGNPIPDPLRAYPGYFAMLYAPSPAFPLRQFRTGSVFDPVVEALGKAGRDRFLADYPAFSTTELYDPEKWHRDRQYVGISGGGGGGWGGEIAILGSGGDPLTLLAYGGGGGGGMTSFARPSAPVNTTLGAGGGGGVQFGNAFRVRNKSYNGLGLGAGTSSNETAVEYSYNDYAGSGRPLVPVNQYNRAVIDDYVSQLANLSQQLRDKYIQGKTVVLMGGGGMGAGTEYLQDNGQEYEPHALSTQSGFQYSYEFAVAGGARGARAKKPAPVQVELEDFYALVGDDFRLANAQALGECGGDYSNYACICPRAHAIVIGLAAEQLGDPKKIPSWLQEPHCGNDSAQRTDQEFTSYQQLLLSTVNRGESARDRALRAYFTSMNTPSREGY